MRVWGRYFRTRDTDASYGGYFALISCIVFVWQPLFIARLAYA